MSTGDLSVDLPADNQRFVCTQCGAIDLLDLAYARKDYTSVGAPLLCTKCQTGVWHDHFTMELVEQD